MTAAESNPAIPGKSGAVEAALLVERHDTVGLLRLNRPAKRNAVNEQMSAEALDALEAFESDDQIRCIVVTGAGDQAFCAGQDMAEASGRVARPDVVRGGGAGGMARRLAACEKPVIAAINGFCYGGGMSVALACDFRLAAETATFRLPGAAYGLVVAATWLTAAVGPAMAKDLIYAHMIAANSPLAIRHAKRIANLAAITVAALAEEDDVNRQLRGGDDNVTRFNQAADRVLKQH